MLITQISVFLENKEGRLADVTGVLGKNDIDVNAMCIADTTDFGILRLIVNKPKKAQDVLKEEGFTVNSTEVLAILVEDKPGGMARALEVLREAGIDIEYVYNFISKLNDKASVILRVEDIERALEFLTEKGVKVLSSEEVYEMKFKEE